jgi:carbonic anhydrase
MRQSPINIDQTQVIKASYCNPLKIFNLLLPSKYVDLKNTGHGATMKLNYQFGGEVHIYGGPLRQPHTLESFHIHWPSEHTLDGRRFDAEIHLVHFNEKYDSYQDARSQPDGLAVLGFFFEVDNSGFSVPNDYLKLFQKVPNDQDARTSNSTIKLHDIIGSEPVNILSYLGSLTTPGCNENVLWMISTRKLKITTAELNELKKIRFDTGVNNSKNFRPVQRLLGRKVYAYDQEKK